MSKFIDSPAAVAGAYADITSKDTDKKRLNDNIKSKKADIMAFIEKNGPVMVYDKNDKPKMLFINRIDGTKLNKKALAADLGLPVRKLTIAKISELTQTGQLNPAKIAEFEEDDTKYRLKTRKASKDEVERARNTPPTKSE